MKSLSLVFIGAPGSGKGTQASLLSAHYKIPHISSGDMLRERIKQGTPTGLKAKPYVTSGALVPDELMVEMILEQLGSLKDFILDGFPRTLPQAESLHTALGTRQINLSAVILLLVPTLQLVRRLSARKRHDDELEAIYNRLHQYREETAPVINYYQSTGLLRQINGSRSISEIHQEIMEALAGDLKIDNSYIGSPKKEQAMSAKDDYLVKVKTITKKMAEQVRVVYPDGLDEETNSIAIRLYILLESLETAPIAWINEKTLRSAGGPGGIILWLIEWNNQVYFLERPGKDSKHYHKTFDRWNHIPQLFVS